MPESLKLVAGFVLIVIVAAFFLLAIILGELYSQLPRYAKYWQVVNSKADKNGLVYVAFGDSAAQGVGASKPQKGYVGLISQELSQKSGNQVQTINLSKSGAKVADVLNTQLPAYEKLGLKKTPIITMEIGANDMLSFNEADFERDMDLVMKKLPKTAVVSDIPFFGGTRFRKVQPKVEVANVILCKLAKKHGITVVPLHDKVKSNTGLNTLAADIFHPSNKAYKENWAPTFLRGIEAQAH